MKRTMVMSFLAIPVAALLATDAWGAENACTDPIPTGKQTKLLKRYTDKGIDANKDGALTCAEVNAFFQANPQLGPQRNRQAECTDPMPADKQAKLLKQFGDKGIDANKDGTLLCSEVNAFFQANPQLKPRRDRAQECTDPIPTDKQAKLLKEHGDKGIDANKDNMLTCTEVNAFYQANPQLKPRHDRTQGCTDPIPPEKQARMLKRFGEKGIDANKDGVVTCDEMKAFYDARAAERNAKTNQPQNKTK